MTPDKHNIANGWDAIDLKILMAAGAGFMINLLQKIKTHGSIKPKELAIDVLFFACSMIAAKIFCDIASININQQPVIFGLFAWFGRRLFSTFDRKGEEAIEKIADTVTDTVTESFKP